MAKKKPAKRASANTTTTAETPKRAYKVGRGRPPDEHKFKKGQPSANPRGRPKGRPNYATMVTDAAFKPLFVNDQRTGERRKMSKIEIGLAVAANKMANGDDKALGRFSTALAQIERDAEANASQIAVNEVDHEVIAEIYRRMQLASIDGGET